MPSWYWHHGQIDEQQTLERRGIAPKCHYDAEGAANNKAISSLRRWPIIITAQAPGVYWSVGVDDGLRTSEVHCAMEVLLFREVMSVGELGTHASSRI